MDVPKGWLAVAGVVVTALTSGNCVQFWENRAVAVETRMAQDQAQACGRSVVAIANSIAESTDDRVAR